MNPTGRTWWAAAPSSGRLTTAKVVASLDRQPGCAARRQQNVSNSGSWWQGFSMPKSQENQLRMRKKKEIEVARKRQKKNNNNNNNIELIKVDSRKWSSTRLNWIDSNFQLRARQSQTWPNSVNEIKDSFKQKKGTKIAERINEIANDASSWRENERKWEPKKKGIRKRKSIVRRRKWVEMFGRDGRWRRRFLFSSFACRSRESYVTHPNSPKPDRVTWRNRARRPRTAWPWRPNQTWVPCNRVKIKKKNSVKTRYTSPSDLLARGWKPIRQSETR